WCSGKNRLWPTEGEEGAYQLSARRGRGGGRRDTLDRDAESALKPCFSGACAAMPLGLQARDGERGQGNAPQTESAAPGLVHFLESVHSAASPASAERNGGNSH